MQSPTRRTYKPTKQIGVGTVEITPLERRYVLEVLDNNRLSAGPFTARFEVAVAEAHHCRFGIMCNSGTSALQIALATLKETEGWKDGDEVLVPAVTFIATSNIVLYNRMRPVFVDVDPITYNIAPNLIEAKITSRTRAIIPVHLFGLPCEMDPICELAQSRGLRIIEDSCETMIAKYKGRPVGSFGDIGCFSTYAAHIIVTGAGGIAVTNNPNYAVILKSLMNHGRDSIYLHIDDDQQADPKKLSEIVNSRFSFIRLGHSFRATELEAALGLAQMTRKDEIIERRRQNATFLTRGLSELREFLQLPSCPSYSDHVYMMYPLVIKDTRVERARLIQFLEGNLIETRYMLPLLNQPIYKKLFGDIEKQYPMAQYINQHGFYVGCHPGLGEEELGYIVEMITEFVRSAVKG